MTEKTDKSPKEKVLTVPNSAGTVNTVLSKGSEETVISTQIQSPQYEKSARRPSIDVSGPPSAGTAITQTTKE